jgi:hypothetical protein
MRTFTFVAAGERLAFTFTTEDKGFVLRRYQTSACRSCAALLPSAGERKDASRALET